MKHSSFGLEREEIVWHWWADNRELIATNQLGYEESELLHRKALANAVAKSKAERVSVTTKSTIMSAKDSHHATRRVCSHIFFEVLALRCVGVPPLGDEAVGFLNPRAAEYAEKADDAERSCVNFPVVADVNVNVRCTN